MTNRQFYSTKIRPKTWNNIFSSGALFLRKLKFLIKFEDYFLEILFYVFYVYSFVCWIPDDHSEENDLNDYQYIDTIFSHGFTFHIIFIFSMG